MRSAATFAARCSSPEDPGYDEARKIYNAMIDKRPALIAQCRRRRCDQRREFRP